jgi:hypothetical protein
MTSGKETRKKKFIQIHPGHADAADAQATLFTHMYTVVKLLLSSSKGMGEGSKSLGDLAQSRLQARFGR